jgi:hypothetical protein
MTSVSLAIDHGEGTRYAAMLLHVWTGGLPVGATVLFGAGGGLVPSPQGPLPSTTIGGQRQTIAGASAAFHAGAHLDGIAEYGRSTYDAQDVAVPGSGRPGAYYHVGATRTAGGASASLDLYRNESYYATALLPYGVPENVWSVAWSWPGQWLKSNYQLISDAPANVDRQGYRVRYRRTTHAIDVRGAYANFGEIDPISVANARRTGFVAMRRPAAPGHPEDHVSFDTPEYVLTASRTLRSHVVASLGFARYAMRGSFAQGYTNVDFRQRTGIAGIQWATSLRAATLVSLRRTAFDGLPAALGDPRPDFVNTLATVEERIKL